jgi:branched-chain amino acid transport system ATP-binding protein
VTVTNVVPGSSNGSARPPTVVLVLRDISVSFGGIRALTEVSMQVELGEVHGLMGPNGAGKTTLFDVVSGVRRPSSGTVLLDNVEVTRWTPVQRARHGLRRTFQRVQVFGRLSVADNLLVPLEHHGGGGGLAADFLALPSRRRIENRRRERVAEVAEMCGLTAMLERPAGSLAIGLGRQVELARALIADPKVLLLDEPTSGLDHTESDRLSGLIAEIASSHQCGIVLVEHDVAFMMHHCRSITVLDLGRVIAEGSPSEIQDNRDVQAAYFD